METPQSAQDRHLMTDKFFRPHHSLPSVSSLLRRWGREHGVEADFLPRWAVYPEYLDSKWTLPPCLPRDGGQLVGVHRTTTTVNSEKLKKYPTGSPTCPLAKHEIGPGHGTGVRFNAKWYQRPGQSLQSSGIQRARGPDTTPDRSLLPLLLDHVYNISSPPVQCFCLPSLQFSVFSSIPS